MLIGELAAELGVTGKTLRHYERIGLLPEAGRSANGYRFYSEAAVQSARRIVALRRLDLSLDEIRTALRDGPDAETRRRLVGLLSEKLHERNVEIAVLQGRRDDLEARLDALLQTPSGSPGTCICGLLLERCKCDNMS